MLPLHSFRVEDVFLPVELDYFASLLLFAVSSRNLNVILSDGHGSNAVLLPQLFGKGRRHNLLAKDTVGRCTEMPFTALALVRNQKGIELHFGRWCFSDGRKWNE